MVIIAPLLLLLVVFATVWVIEHVSIPTETESFVVDDCEEWEREYQRLSGETYPGAKTRAPPRCDDPKIFRTVRKWG